MAARNEERLRKKAAKIRGETGRQTEDIAADLSVASEVSALAERLQSDPAISILVNNAGATLNGGLLANETVSPWI